MMPEIISEIYMDSSRNEEGTADKNVWFVHKESVYLQSML